jgi:hypothetical protein
MKARDPGLVQPPFDHRLPPEFLWRRRRELLASGVQITAALAPEIHARIEESRRLLGVELPVEVYQFASASPEAANASFWGQGEAVVLSLDGALLGRFDPPGLLFFLGHELGHHLAHGSPPSWLEHVEKIQQPLFSPTELRALLRRAQELTADRFGLLVCRDLDAVLRAQVTLATGMPAAVRWEPRVYLDGCRAYVEALRHRREPTGGVSHPEHSLRSYALWLFSESDLYRELTGAGSGRLRLEVVDRDLTTLLGLPPWLSQPISLPAPAPPPVAPAPPPSRPLAPHRPAPSAPRPGPAPALVSAPVVAPREPPAPRAPLPEPRSPAPFAGLLERGQGALRKVTQAALGREEATPEEVPDPLLDDERELLARFEALERKARTR